LKHLKKIPQFDEGENYVRLNCCAAFLKSRVAGKDVLKTIFEKQDGQLVEMKMFSLF
jgi:hypothetical protein